MRDTIADGMAVRKRPAPKLGTEELLHMGMRLLAGRSLSAQEVRTRLARRAREDADLDAVLARLREYGAIDDSRFAENFAGARRDGGLTGKARVLRDLRQRRVSQSVAEKAVQEAFQDVDESAAAAQFLKRKYRNTNLADHLSDPKNLASAYRKLRYAGFSSSASVGVL
jgi:regulatory protein